MGKEVIIDIIKRRKVEQKKFKVFGEPWKIQWTKCIVCPNNPEMWRFGETNNATHTIRISQESVEGIPVPERTQELTKMHELVHVILDEGQYLEESQNEPLVEWIAKCLVSLKEQNVL